MTPLSWNLTIISFTGNTNSTLAKNSDITFLIPDCEKLDNDNYYPNPFFAYCIETFELMIHKYFNFEISNFNIQYHSDLLGGHCLALLSF